MINFWISIYSWEERKMCWDSRTTCNLQLASHLAFLWQHQSAKRQNGMVYVNFIIYAIDSCLKDKFIVLCYNNLFPSFNSFLTTSYCHVFSLKHDILTWYVMALDAWTDKLSNSVSKFVGANYKHTTNRI